MIYGLRNMIYLLRKHGIISVPIIREAYIICEADIIALAISSVTARNGYHCKNPLLSSRQKRVFTCVITTALIQFNFPSAFEPTGFIKGFI